MQAPHYMPLFWQDLLTDNKVRVMDNRCFGAYIKLLGAAWMDSPPGSLTNDDEALAKLCDESSDGWQQIKLVVLGPFTPGRDGRLYQKRMQQVYSDVIKKVKSRSESASKAALARWGNANALRTHCEDDAIKTKVKDKQQPNVRAREAPTLEQALSQVESMRQAGADYTDEDCRQAWLSLEASKDDFGRWRWGSNSVGDWRSALESRMGDNRLRSVKVVASRNGKSALPKSDWGSK